ncbi:ATP12-domain-containing protein [Dimargaris cristalligena]|uniref:ATP12-domain-containing protein n=1 Tax=Dimargaris cristalligena TaxID=215637 RepID=A0A4V1J4S3_9FUNG|nr:ATP12-domain-containing protein [Dimargaris cristalligena]|eukprot:RKP36559.1 ATP12-domain-containing protein [Dimargaris cristalligena]
MDGAAGLSTDESAAAPKTKPALSRFWKQVTLESTDGKAKRNGKFQVKLDKRPIKTPDGQKIEIAADRKILGLLLVAEWDSQTKVIKPHSLPLTSLVARSMDGLSSNQQRQDVIKHLSRYLHTDAICFQQTYPQPLVDLQDKAWSPIIEWIQTEYKVKINVTDELFGMSQTPETEAQLLAVVSEFHPLKLAAFERAVMHSKSFLLGLALVNRLVSVEQAVEASQVELLAQIKQWGLVEDNN